MGGRKPKNRESGDSDTGPLKEKKKPGRPPKERTMSDDSVFENGEEVKIRKKPGRKPKIPRENEEFVEDREVKVRKKPGRKPKDHKISENFESELPINDENILNDENASEIPIVKEKKKRGRKPKEHKILEDSHEQNDSRSKE